MRFEEEITINEETTTTPSGKTTTRRTTTIKRTRQELRRLIAERDSYTCFYCGRSVIDRYNMQIDHIVPKHFDGSGTADNVVTSCSSCNNHKSNYLMEFEYLNQVLDEIRRRNEEYGIDPDTLILKY